MSDLAGPGPSWSDEIVKLEREIRAGEPMQVERVQIKSDGFTFYRIHSEYAKDSVAVGPRELMKLLTWLQENEQQIIQDSLDNDVQAHDDIHTVEAYRREYEMKQSDGEWVNGDEED